MNPQELRLEHIAPYLPYELNTKYRLGNVIGNLQGANLDEIRDKKLAADNVEFVLKYCKPILRPLSDLTKNEFDDLYEDLSYQSKGFIIREDLVGNWAESMPYYDFKKLLKNHVDVFGLIEKGLAIDFNQLKLTDN